MHGRFDESILKQYEIVDKIVSKEAQELGSKAILSRDGGDFFVTLYNVIGFIFLVLGMIKSLDFVYSISSYGEEDLIARLSKTKDSKQTASMNKNEEFTRLRSTLAAIGLPKFNVDAATLDFLVDKFVWRH